jgi:hypothetical protein
MIEPRSSAKKRSDRARRIYGLQLQLARFGVPPVPLDLDVPPLADAAPKGKPCTPPTPASEGDL